MNKLGISRSSSDVPKTQLEKLQEKLPIGSPVYLIQVNRCGQATPHFRIFKTENNVLDDLTFLVAPVIEVRRNDKTGGIPWRNGSGNDLAEYISFKIHGRDNQGKNHRLESGLLKEPKNGCFVAGFTLKPIVI